MEGFNHEMVEPEGTCRCILAQFPHSAGGGRHWASLTKSSSLCSLPLHSLANQCVPTRASSPKPHNLPIPRAAVSAAAARTAEQASTAEEARAA